MKIFQNSGMLGLGGFGDTEPLRQGRVKCSRMGAVGRLHSSDSKAGRARELVCTGAGGGNGELDKVWTSSKHCDALCEIDSVL